MDLEDLLMSVDHQVQEVRVKRMVEVVVVLKEDQQVHMVLGLLQMVILELVVL